MENVEYIEYGRIVLIWLINSTKTGKLKKNAVKR